MSVPTAIARLYLIPDSASFARLVAGFAAPASDFRQGAVFA